MNPVEIPFAVWPYTLLIGAGTSFIAVVVLWWTLPKFLVFLRVVSGREPRKPGTKTVHLVAGFFIFAFLFSLAAIPGGIFIQLLTQPPTLVSDQGVTGGGGLLFARKTITWSAMEHVTCLQRRDRTISSIGINSAGDRIDIGSTGMSDLAPILALIRARTAPGVVHSCTIPFRD